MQFELKRPISYNVDGKEVEANFIEIKEPTGKIAHLVSIIKSELALASKNAFSGLDMDELPVAEAMESDDLDSDGSTEVGVMLMGGADMEKVIIAFKEILKETATIGGEKSFTEPMFNRMYYGDVEGLLGGYIANFMPQ